MRTQILSKLDLSPAIFSLKAGFPVAFPTETVYGLGAPIFNIQAVQRIFSIKKRPADNPLIAHISDFSDLEKIVMDLDPRFFVLAEHFWPGPLAIIVKKNPAVPDIVTAGHATLAIRMPLHETARELIAQVGEPLVAPSANLSGRPSPTTLQDVLEDLEGLVPYVIDGGETDIGIESTVLLLGKSPTILRPGHIAKEALENVLKETVQDRYAGPFLSPGMKYRHYAPKAKLRLIFDENQLGKKFIEPTQQSLYKGLREADRQMLDEIEIYLSPSVQKDVALMNRLLRAAGQIS